MLAHHPLVSFGITCITVVRTDDSRQLSRTLVGGSRHQAGDSSSERTSTIGVVWKTGGHQESTQVRVTDTELAVLASGVTDRLGREVGEADRDVHGGDDQFH